jgi:isopenicillin-N N-acyltransferase-like protein
VGITVATYERMLRESAGLGPGDLRAAGSAVGAALSARRPDLVEELEGIAAGAHRPLETLLAINARTELLGGRGPGECSVAGVLSGRGVTLAQNWDWHPQLIGARVVWTIEGEDGWLTTVTEAGMVAKIGVSGHGLAVALNFLTSTADGGVGNGGMGGIPIHVLLRTVLDRCASLLEALTLLVQADVTASSCVTVAGREAGGCGLVAVELSPEGPGVVRPDSDGLLVHTNHFAAAPSSLVDTQPREHPGTLLRAWRLRRRLRAGASVEDALADHFGAPEAICRHFAPGDAWPDRRATLLSVVMDPGRPALRLAAGSPCAVPYEDVALPPARRGAA